MTVELPGLIAALTPLLGDITSINVNWPHLQRPPDFNWPGWEHKPQHVMTINGEKARVNLLIIPVHDLQRPCPDGAAAGCQPAGPAGRPRQTPHS